MTSRTITLNSTIYGTVDCQNKVNLTQLSITPTLVTTNHTVTTNEYLIYVDTAAATGGVSITLPLASSVGNQTFYIVDATGAANTKNITILASGSDLICGQSSVLINVSYTSLTFFAYGPKNIYSII
jgi:hypothetical protein